MYILFQLCCGSIYRQNSEDSFLQKFDENHWKELSVSEAHTRQ